MRLIRSGCRTKVGEHCISTLPPTCGMTSLHHLRGCISHLPMLLFGKSRGMLRCRQARSRVYSHFKRELVRDCCAKTPQQSLRALCGVFGCWQHKYGIIKPKAAHPVKEEENEQSRSKRKLPHCFLCGSFCFFSAAPLRAPTVPFRLILPPQKAVFARRICGRSAARLSREWLPVLPKGRTIPEKKASEHRSGHLFYCFLPFLQCFL